MRNRVLIVGATGLVGSTFLNLIKNDPSYEKIITITRREILPVRGLPNIEQHVSDFERLEACSQIIKADFIVCTLGTTIKKAGSRENFYKVDYNLPLRVAQYAKENDSKNFIIVTAIDANPNSRLFFNRVKGEIERDIQKINFESFHILRPSLILGSREEFRLAEEFGKVMTKIMNPFIPRRYKPVHPEMLAKKIDSIIKFPSKGIHIYEGARILV